MATQTKPDAGKAVDKLQMRLAQYAAQLNYESLTPLAIHAAKVRIIDTLGALLGGYFGEPCHIVREVSALMPDAHGATVIGTRMRTTPDMAAFANATTARYVELTDSYHWPGGFGGHPSDVIMPVLAAAEHAHVSGRDFILGVVLAYEVFLRIDDVFDNMGIDYTTFACLGTAVAAARLFNLTQDQIAHCISMAVVPNVILRQVRTDHLSMFKEAAAGQAGRAGLFAAMLARAGMEGPHLPFAGKAGWYEHVARKQLNIDTLGGSGVPFKISDTQIKIRSSAGGTISSILAAEKVAPLGNVEDVAKVTVEVYSFARELVGLGAHRWNPDTRESADHSIPYTVASVLMDGTITPRSFDDGKLRDPRRRALMQKVEVIENDEFNRAYNRHPQEHHTRVTVALRNGSKLVGVTGGDDDDMGKPRSDAQIEQKFRGLAEDTLGARRSGALLAQLWRLEEVTDIAQIPPALVIV